MGILCGWAIPDGEGTGSGRMIEGLTGPEAMMGETIGPGGAIVPFSGPSSATPFGEAGNDCGADSGRLLDGLTGTEARLRGTIGPGLAILSSPRPSPNTP